ncbi:hypothetical protein PO124_29445 [Bacillus licheniformis]|nr:hypothetical protein [Bacillus licheniformis]
MMDLLVDRIARPELKGTYLGVWASPSLEAWSALGRGNAAGHLWSGKPFSTFAILSAATIAAFLSW